MTQKYSRKICSKAAFQSPWHYQNRLFKVFQGLGSNPGSGVPYGAPLNTRLLRQPRNNARIFFLHKIFHLFFNEKVSSDFFSPRLWQDSFSATLISFFSRSNFSSGRDDDGFKVSQQTWNRKIVEIWNFSCWRQVDRRTRRSASQKKSFLRPRVVI